MMVLNCTVHWGICNRSSTWSIYVNISQQKPIWTDVGHQHSPSRAPLHILMLSGDLGGKQEIWEARPLKIALFRMLFVHKWWYHQGLRAPVMYLLWNWSSYNGNNSAGHNCVLGAPYYTMNNHHVYRKATNLSGSYARCLIQHVGEPMPIQQDRGPCLISIATWQVSNNLSHDIDVHRIPGDQLPGDTRGMDHLPTDSPSPQFLKSATRLSTQTAQRIVRLIDGQYQLLTYGFNDSNLV